MRGSGRRVRGARTQHLPHDSIDQPYQEATWTRDEDPQQRTLICVGLEDDRSEEPCGKANPSQEQRRPNSTTDDAKPARAERSVVEQDGEEQEDQEKNRAHQKLQYLWTRVGRPDDSRISCGRSWLRRDNVGGRATSNLLLRCSPGYRGPDIDGTSVRPTPQQP